jgi:hypothetical protein
METQLSPSKNWGSLYEVAEQNYLLKLAFANARKAI